MATTLRARAKCTSGCNVLDAAVLGGGGFPSGSITELVGESGAAKTQLVLQLLVAAQLPQEQGGLNGASICFYTEGYFAHRRLRQIAASFRRDRKLGFDPCKNILVQAVESVQDAFAALERLDKTMIAQQQRRGFGVRLLAIDSIAALFRSEFDNNRAEMVARSSILFQLGAKLKAMAQDFNLVVVVTNQVMDCIGDAGVQVGNLPDLVSSGRKVAPALGLAWSHCINSRLFLARHSHFVPNFDSKRRRLDPAAAIQGDDEIAEHRSITRRVVHLLFAPHLPYSSCEFVVDEGGVHGVGGHAAGICWSGDGRSTDRVDGRFENRDMPGVNGVDGRSEGPPRIPTELTEDSKTGICWESTALTEGDIDGKFARLAGMC